ncbi:MAG: hypothetical protein ACRCWD_08180 [Culicoidibacterales bacterium]
MKEIINLNSRQKEIIREVGGPLLAADQYTEADVDALVQQLTLAFAANSDAEGTPNDFGLEVEALLDFLQTLPVQLESLAEFAEILAKDFDLVCRYQQRTYLIEHTKNGLILAEKGRISTRKTFSTAQEALNGFIIAGNKLADVILEFQIIDLILTDEAFQAQYK